MNFDDTPQEAEFRATARKWIGANAPKQYEAELSKSSLGRIRLEKEEIVDVGKAWQKKKAEGGWACLHWPKEYGGRGATPIEKVIWQQEEGVYGKLTQPFQIGEGMCGPTVMAFGSEEHKRHYLPKLASGEHIWCQLFSEPAGGSDVAGLRTRAEKKGDNWIVNGQKIWTSGAHYSDYGLLITRTDPNVPKHKGLTMFFLDMKSKGVEVRPIKQANGMQEFNEVYFTDVVIPDQPAPRRRRRRLERVADHADERAHVDRFAAGDRLSRNVRVLLEPDDRRWARDRRSRDAFKACELGGEGERPEIHQLPRHLVALEGRAAGSGKFHRQAGLRLDAAGHRDLCDGSGGRGRCAHRRGRGSGERPVPADAAVVALDAHRRRYRRNPAQHHRRARAGPARRYPRRQGRAASTRSRPRGADHGREGTEGTLRPQIASACSKSS